MGLLDRFRSARQTVSAADLHGSWHLVRSEATLDAGNGVEMEFRPTGELVYAIDVGDRWQIMQLTYRLDGAQLITDQPSKPREERTPILLGADDTLVLGELGARTWFRRGKNSAPAV